MLSETEKKKTRVLNILSMVASVITYNLTSSTKSICLTILPHCWKELSPAVSLVPLGMYPRLVVGEGGNGRGFYGGNYNNS